MKNIHSRMLDRRNQVSSVASVIMALMVCTFAATPSLKSAEKPKWESKLADLLPTNADGLTHDVARRIGNLKTEIESTVGEPVFASNDKDFGQRLATAERVLATKKSVDDSLSQVLTLRSSLVDITPEDKQRSAARSFLQISNELMDLSGRLRFLVYDAVRTAAVVAKSDVEREKLLDLLESYRSGNGTAAICWMLFDPPQGSDVHPAAERIKLRLLRLVGETGEAGLLYFVAQVIRGEETPPRLLIQAIKTAREIGLPQATHPDQDPKLGRPTITAAEILPRLAKVDASPLSVDEKKDMAELNAWLTSRAKQGVIGDKFRVAGHDLKAGDWLLMRNPSPYNLFTDLSPGLFTHVGVVTTVTPPDGIRRFVIVDLPEKGDKVPVTNVEIYLQRTLNYFFMRHDESKVAVDMAEAARQMIGNPTQFDLAFRTSRVEAYADAPLTDKRIHTYCAGFLLLCSQHANVPRTEMFPLVEYVNHGEIGKNLKTLGLSVGDNFVSPTGALFSSKLTIAARSRPMYDPTREVKEIIYDHFAKKMRTVRLHQSPNSQQALREKLARLAAGNQLLTQALARASGVSEHLDLVSAAKAAAVVETLDEIADGAMGRYADTNYAFHAGTIEQLQRQGVRREVIDMVQRVRATHREAYQGYQNREVSPLRLRNILVKHYSAQGRRELDERFFTPVP